MAKNMNNHLENLQKDIFLKNDGYGVPAFDRMLNPLYRGALAGPDGYARVTGPCGDTMEIFLRFDHDRINEASFETDGCGSSALCGSFAAEMALGKTPDELLGVTGDAILEKMGGAPEKEQHCAHLAGETLQEALSSYMINNVPPNEK
ncbi:MAG: iron-sulfur cluster assembly scaffold protein [Deltaproteobacteria bacterium]|nr:iron-sulfur cluster assembly scaffold protein [Deltaproteobacteria bacterium]